MDGILSELESPEMKTELSHLKDLTENSERVGNAKGCNAGEGFLYSEIYSLMLRKIRTVACAVSGGVDSAVSAYLLKRNGYDVKGVFMRNWDNLEEGGGCSEDADRQDAKLVCERLNIPFYEVNFVREYWNYVFLYVTFYTSLYHSPLLHSYQKGATPNPDILCNRFVKFPLLTRYLLAGTDETDKSPKFHDRRRSDLQVDAIATGHYCRNSLGNFLQQKTNQEATLMRSVDPVKDQTFWLSTISHKDLQRCMFPVGGLLKPAVKQIAVDIGLGSIAARRESMGMCFIGKRSFGQFIDSYIEPRRGVFKELETGLTLDEHTGVHHYTLGQRAQIKRYNGPFYISRIDARNQTIYVVRDPSHPTLFFRKCWTGPVVWINSVGPHLPSSTIRFQWQNKWRSIACRLRPHSTLADAFRDACQSTSCPLDEGICSELLDSIPVDVDTRPPGPFLAVELAEPMRCIATGQWSAFYDGERCLGGAMVCGAVSLWDEGWQDSYTGWKQTDFEITYGNLLEKCFRPRR